MFIIKNRKIFFSISAILVIASILSIFVWGLKPGIEFTGGTLLEIEYTNSLPSHGDLETRLVNMSIGNFSLQQTGENGYLIRTRDLNEPEREEILKALSFEGNTAIQKRINTIGPSIGTELRNKSYFAIGLVVLAIVLFIALSFRKVSKPVSSFKYGLVAIVALLHDILIPTGFFVLLGQITHAEVDVLFVTALLAILGFSVNDTIVVFDRIRENLRINEEMNRSEKFENVVGLSLDQTISRSINTSLTTLLVLLALYIFGGDSTKLFALTLVIGVIAGTYSSIFLASPMLLWFNKGR